MTGNMDNFQTSYQLPLFSNVLYDPYQERKNKE